MLHQHIQPVMGAPVGGVASRQRRQRVSRRRRALRFLSSFFRLSRAGNLLLLGSSLYLAAIFLVRPDLGAVEKLLNVRFLAGVVATAFITAAGYIINDYYDVRIDRVNRPAATIVGRRISRRWALMLHFVLTAIGLAIAVVTSLKLAMLEGTAALLLVWYSMHLKRTAFYGNFLVALLSATTLLVPAILFDHFSLGVWVFFVFSFLGSLMREVIKDLEDMRGDAQFGCQTLPIVWGIRRTTKLVAWMGGLFIVVLLIESFWLSLSLFAYSLLLIVPVVVYIIIKIPKADTRLKYKTLSLACKLMLGLGIAGMLFV